jgi:hypothetical protein
MSSDQTLLVLSVKQKLENIMSLIKDLESEAGKLDKSDVSLDLGMCYTDETGEYSCNRYFRCALGEFAKKKNLTDPRLRDLVEEYENWYE